MRLAESYSRATIVKTYTRDGKHYATIKDVCDRCNGKGVFIVAVHNGQGVPAQPDNGVCYKCYGAGNLVKDVRMYTEAEFERMEKAKKTAAEKKQTEWDKLATQRLAEKNIRTLQRYGFQSTEAYVVLGNTFDIIDELKEVGARFSPELHWVCPTEPTWLIAHGYVRVSVEDVFTINEHGAFELRDDAAEFVASFESVSGEYIGTIGSRISITATLVRDHEFGSQFGTMHIYIFETLDGNTLVWKTASAWLTVDKEYQIVGTVKEHSEYNKVRQTVLARCKIKGE